MQTLRIILYVSVLSCLPAVAYGAVGDGIFVPITPLPSLDGSSVYPTATSRGDLSGYINTMFQYAIITGAGLAAIYIGIGGFEYILSEATETKHNGRLRIIHALYGLAILLLVTIILFIINPDLVTLKFLK